MDMEMNGLMGVAVNSREAQDLAVSICFDCQKDCAYQVRIASHPA